jgi:hypothetical protein
MTMLHTPKQIELARLATLRAAVRLELVGMKRNGRPASAIARELLGLPPRTNKAAVLAALTTKIHEEMPQL